MGKLIPVSFEEEPVDIKEKVKGYWAKRSESFAEQKEEEAFCKKAKLWRTELLSALFQESALASNANWDLHILDVGCGAGFFEMILAPEGVKMTGIDLTPEMIEKGQQLLKQHGLVSARLMVMDAERTEFPDECFDAVITRNLTWTLPHPEEAYREWFRILKPGGVLLNYDAEYAKGFHHYDQSENCAHSGIGDEMVEECHNIYHMLSISSFNRPEWDIEVLNGIGFREVTADRSVGNRIYAERDSFYIPDRMFAVRAVK